MGISNSVFTLIHRLPEIFSMLIAEKFQPENEIFPLARIDSLFTACSGDFITTLAMVKRAKEHLSLKFVHPLGICMLQAVRILT